MSKLYRFIDAYVVAFKVYKSAKLIDDKRENWQCKIDIAILDMESTTEDILGQLYGTYLDGLEELNISANEWFMYGFTTNKYFNNSYHNLGEAWIREINKRLTKVLKINKEPILGAV